MRGRLLLEVFSVYRRCPTTALGGECELKPVSSQLAMFNALLSAS